VDVDVPEVLFRRARSRGLKVWATFPGDDARHPLALREFEAETAEVGQTYRLTLAFREDPGDWVLPGASATVTALAPASGDAVAVPESALVFGPDRAAHVMVFNPSAEDPDQGVVALTPVTIRFLPDGRPALTSGPPPGAQIVAAGAALLQDGQRVRRFTGVGE
jgi:multidrug efflux pump subunit AcrA (membrane-fusion protein)